MKNTALRRALALTLVLSTSGCFLPPPAEDWPLTGALDAASGGLPDSETATGADLASEDPALEPLTDSAGSPGEASQGGLLGDPGATTLVEVQAGPGGGLEPIGGVDETVAVAPQPPPASAAGDATDQPAGLPAESLSGQPLAQVAEPGDGAAEPAVGGEVPGASVPGSTEGSGVGDGVLAGALDGTLDGTLAGAPAETPSELLPVAALDEEPEVEVALITLEVETSDGLVMSYLFKDADEPVPGAPPVVFIHGWCGRSDQWANAMEAVSVGRRVYAVDLIGHGRSKGQSRVEWTISKYGADIVRLLEDQQLESAVLVGHGMGGQVALSAAARAPSRIAGILGVDCLQRLAGDPMPERVEPHVQGFTLAYGEQMRKFVDLAVHASTSTELKERIVEDCLAADKAAALALMENFGIHDPRREAPKIECGVVCINSESLRADVDGNRSLLSSFELRTIKDTGHWIHLESPVPFVAELKAYLGGLKFESAPATSLETMYPILLVQDVESASAFYTDGLGFELVRRRPQDTAETPIVVTLERNDVRLVIQSVTALQDELPEAKIVAGGGALILRVGSIAGELRTLGKRAKILSPERALPSGAKQVVISDPEGNVVVLQEKAAKSLE